jgi:hypothetical protein
VPDCGLGGVVRSLRLWDVDDGTAHGTDHDDAARRLALHQVLGDTDSEEPGTVNVDTPQLLHTVVWVIDGREVLGEAGGGDQVVDLAVLRDDLVKRRGYGLGLRDVGIVCGDLGYIPRAWVFPLELLDQGLGLLLAFVLCYKSSAYA